MGPAWARSRALPCGTPSMTSTSTTSPSSRSTTYWATEAPTLPAPTTVILGRGCFVLRISALPSCIPISRYGLQRRHALDDRRPELRALHLGRPLHEPREVVRHHLRLDRLLEPPDDPVRRVAPAHVAQHHLAREDDRARVDLVLARVLRRRAVRRLEERVASLVVDVGARRDPDPAHLGGERVGEEVAREVRGGDHVELVRAREDLLEERVGDRVLDEDLAGRRLAAAVVPRHGLVAEFALRERVAPLHEHPFRVFLDVSLVDERHVLPVILDRVADRRADQTLGALLGDGLDADRRGAGEADLGDLHLLLEEIHHPLRLRRPLLPLDPRVDVLRVLSEDDHVHLVRPFDRRRHTLEVLDRAQADIQVEHLTKRHVQRAEPFTDRRGERALDRDQVLTDDVERLLGQEVRRALAAVDGLRLLTRVHLDPGDLLLPAVGLLDRRVEHPHGCAPDVRAGAVTLDERDDRVVRDPELAVVDRDLLALRELDPARHLLPVPLGRVQRRPGLEPRDVLPGEAVERLDGLRPSVGLLDRHAHGLPRLERREAADAHTVLRLETLVVARVLEREGQDALLLEVRLVDAGEALDEDDGAAQVARRHRRVLAARAFTIVLVADDHPAHALGLELARDLREGLRRAPRERVDALARLAAERVHGAEEHVVADLVEVTAVAEPRPGRRYMIGRRLALRLYQNRQVDEILTVPRPEGL